MNKRQKKKYAKKFYYKRYDNPKLHPKTLIELFKLTYRDPHFNFKESMRKLRELIPTKEYTNIWSAPVILGQEHGATFNNDLSR